jgi:hypothetical protein
MSLTITAEERDALYNRIVVRLNGIDAVYRAVEEEDWAAAQEQGQEFADLLQLICTDLGWGMGRVPETEMKTPLEVLARAAGVIRDLARCDESHHSGEARSAMERAEEARFLRQTCERLLNKTASSKG